MSFIDHCWGDVIEYYTNEMLNDIYVDQVTVFSRLARLREVSRWFRDYLNDPPWKALLYPSIEIEVYRRTDLFGPLLFDKSNQWDLTSFSRLMNSRCFDRTCMIPRTLFPTGTKPQCNHNEVWAEHVMDVLWEDIEYRRKTGKKRLRDFELDTIEWVSSNNELEGLRYSVRVCREADYFVVDRESKDDETEWSC